ncbi:ComEA family DNA-binding protein [Streptomyces sp. MBT27]|uniref:ComEA family DNA-binding protein n=1 Tax=Streptomyces sp. MBT27 TaxID=1488356 RepID=UPI0014233C80|nr:ComEA family DNA-binding protein [Streptomyces sp. MBT27]
MAIRSPRTATSGPGRAPGSDGRARPGYGRRGRAPQAPVSVLTARSRADALFLPPPPGTAASPPEPAPPPAPAAATARTLGQSALAPERLVPDRLLPEREVRGRGAAHWSERPERNPPLSEASAVPPPAVVLGVRERVSAALRERLPLWAQSRCGLAPRSLAALCVVLVVAAGFAIHHFWVGRPQSVRAPERVDGAEPAPSGSASAAAGKGASRGSGGGIAGAGAMPRPVANAAPSPAGVLVVDVGGKVRRPGIYRLPNGSRVADALAAAGGVREGADLTGLNRARPLTDGEQVLAGVPGAAPAGPGAGTGGGGSAGGAGGPVNLNSASVDQLDGLPGVGPVLAQHIVDYRAQHGGFRSVDELREVNGIGERRFDDLQPLVRL